MKILIVEDEERLNQLIMKVLRKIGYTVDSAFDGEQALDLFFDNNYDLIVLDLNLPKLDGMEVLKSIQEDHPNIPVIILSARSEINDKIQGLDDGANDYLTKPFHFEELTARIRALLRTNTGAASSKITIGSVMLDTSISKVEVDGNVIALSKKEYGIIAYLMLNEGQTIPAHKLIDSVWESQSDISEETLYVRMSELRRKLPKDFIKNVRGKGYYVE